MADDTYRINFGNRRVDKERWFEGEEYHGIPVHRQTSRLTIGELVVETETRWLVSRPEGDTVSVAVRAVYAPGEPYEHQGSWMTGYVPRAHLLEIADTIREL